MVKMERAQAEEIAVRALAYIAANEELLPRFLNISGIKASEIRQAASTPGFLAGVLQFILAHEPTLIDFSQASEIPPQRVAVAARSLPFGEESWDYQP